MHYRIDKKFICGRWIRRLRGSSRSLSGCSRRRIGVAVAVVVVARIIVVVVRISRIVGRTSVRIVHVINPYGCKEQPLDKGDLNEDGHNGVPLLRDGQRVVNNPLAANLVNAFQVSVH